MNIKQKITTLGFLVLSGLAINSVYSPLVAADCAGVRTSIINCTQSGQGSDAQDSGVWGILLLVLNIMTAGVGIVAVGGIVYGSILYASAGDDSGQVKQAKDIIQNVVIGLVAYGGMYLILNFLIPGGIFS
jgi:hypothetical protein